jgi:hypothetical protein
MERDIFENKANPFTVPDGYFDTLQERIMSWVQAEESHAKVQGRTIRMNPYRTLVAAAACILFIFAGATLYMTNAGKQNIIAEMNIDDDFYQWFYELDRATILAGSFDLQIPDNFLAKETAYSEEDEAIIRFLERDNIHVMAIVHSMNNVDIFNQQ